MYFYIDESGHTGLNLFDVTQPTLYYGTLSSPSNLDIEAEDAVKNLRTILNVNRIHASQLGNGELVKIAPMLKQLAIDFNLVFDLHMVSKPDHAIIQFFDQTFDQGMNPAMSWTGYWTPLRYALLIQVALLFDESMIEKAWEARITTDDQEAENKLVNVCSSILSKVDRLPDARARELISDAMNWVITNPSEIGYNISSKAESHQISPNLVGFQSVLHRIATRSRESDTQASNIIVDQQLEFNKAQEWIHDLYRSTNNQVFSLGAVGMPEMNFEKFPSVPIVCTPGDKSAGLELVDVYLWIMKRIIEDKSIAPELEMLCKDQTDKGGSIDEISLLSINNRWLKYFASLPTPPDGYNHEETKARNNFFQKDEERRKSHVGNKK